MTETGWSAWSKVPVMSVGVKDMKVTDITGDIRIDVYDDVNPLLKRVVGQAWLPLRALHDLEKHSWWLEMFPALKGPHKNKLQPAFDTIDMGMAKPAHCLGFVHVTAQLKPRVSLQQAYLEGSLRSQLDSKVGRYFARTTGVHDM